MDALGSHTNNANDTGLDGELADAPQRLLERPSLCVGLVDGLAHFVELLGERQAEVAERRADALERARDLGLQATRFRLNASLLG